MTPPGGVVGTKKSTPQDEGTSGNDAEIETKEIEKKHEEPLNDAGVSEELPFIVKTRDTTTATGKRKKQKEDKS